MQVDRIQPKIEEDRPFMQREITVAGIENPQKEFDPQDATLINTIKLQNFFGMNNPSLKERGLIDSIYGYYSKAGINSMNDVFMEINHVELKLGSTPLGQTRLNHLWNYLKILSQISQYGELKNSYERK